MRREVVAFCNSFARLTAHFVSLDVRVLHHQLSCQDLDRYPELMSPMYLLALTTALRKDFRTVSRYVLEDLAVIMDHFMGHHTGLRGSLAYLAKLAELLVSLIPRLPRLIDQCSYLSTMVSLIVQESERKLHTMDTSPALENQLRGHVVLGHKVFSNVSAALSDVIDKSVSSLSSENGRDLIYSLGEIILYSLQVDHPQSRAMREQFCAENPGICQQYVPDVCATKWRFELYRRLIVSSQMQLRVMAVTQLCQSLLSAWKKYGEAPQNSQQLDRPVLQTISDFLTDTGLVSYLLGPTCHPEIISESYNITGFLAVTQTFSHTHTDLMWQTMTTTQDPRISDALIRTSTRILHLHSRDALYYLCQKFRDLPIESWHQPMREFASHCFTCLANKTVEDRSILDGSIISILLNLLKQSSVFGTKSPVAYPDIQKYAISKLSELLRLSTVGPEARRNICKSCLEDIKSKSATSLGSLWGLFANIRPIQNSTYDVYDLMTVKELSEILIEELDHAIAMGPKAGYPEVISGDHNMPRRELLSNTITSHPETLTDELGAKLWDLLVGPGATCQQDRDAGWKMINACFKRPRGSTNSFLRLAFKDFLPTLPPKCFCEGSLEFLREVLMPIVNDPASIALDEQENRELEIEQLWRIVLTAPNQTIERPAIATLVNDIYLDSRSVTAFSLHRARKVHLALVSRCLKQLSSAAKKLKSSSEATTGGDGESAIMGASERQIREQDLLFVRSLAVLREFLRLYRTKSHFAAPDLRSYTQPTSSDIEGELTDLKFQSFDGNLQTEMKPLKIGRRNTAGALLASLKEATGFDNYRVYYRGRAFVPHESDIRKSLEDLSIDSGLLLVKRETDVATSTVRIRPGTSPVEIEILGHFDELWDYLAMEDRLAAEIYTFLIRLPLDEHALGGFQKETLTHGDIFPPNHPYRSLYALHALREYLSLRRRTAVAGPQHPSTPETHESTKSYPDAWTRVTSLVIAAICDFSIIDQCRTPELQVHLSVSLVESLVKNLKDPLAPAPNFAGLDATLLSRLIDIMSLAMKATPTDASTRLISLTFQAILDCCCLSLVFWQTFQASTAMTAVLRTVLLDDWRPVVRKHTAKTIGERTAFGQSHGVVGAAEFREFFWPIVISLIPAAVQKPQQCEEVFDLSFALFKMLKDSESKILDIPMLLTGISQTLLDHTTVEDITQPESVDLVTFGLVRILHAVLSTSELSSHCQAALSSDFTHTVFWKHLFPPWDVADDGLLPQVVIHQPTRTMLIQVIFNLLGADPSRLTQTLQDLNELVPYEQSEEGMCSSYVSV